jgi:hypothetical protein
MQIHGLYSAGESWKPAGSAPAYSFSCRVRRPTNPGARMPVEPTEVPSSPYLSQVLKERMRIVCLVFRSRRKLCAAYLGIEISCSRLSN